ncbi:hypothetical protein G6F59_015026 [Rhizopus arrhizus]|nr:hypothetical protein G6F59_015026 [Rhizopus arrhizus]
MARGRPKLPARPYQYLMAETVAFFHVGQQRHAQFHVATGHRRFDLRAVQVHQVQHHLGIAPAKARQQVGQEIAQHGIGGRDPHRAAQRIALEAGFADGVVQRIQDVLRASMKVVAFRRQRDAMRVAVEQAHAPLRFQRQHGSGDGGLRDMLVGRCHGKPARAGGRREVAQLPQGDVVCHLIFEYLLPETMNIR